MTGEECNQLEFLLSKLQSDLNSRICVVPGHIHDGYYIGLYSKNSGHILMEQSGPTIESVVTALKNNQSK